MVHAGFEQPPESVGPRGRFSVRNHYLSSDGTRTVCEEVCRYTFEAREESYLIDWDSTFSSNEADFYFGDQEEMGLGVRVATDLREAGGTGRILNSAAARGAKTTWGKPASWCDYSGTSGDRVGVTIMTSPDNYRPSWWHNRDYGLSVANLFGREAMRQGPPSKIVVKRGEKFRLRYGVLLHVSRESPFDPGEQYQRYVDALRRQPANSAAPKR